jgi:hypothetical protein
MSMTSDTVPDFSENGDSSAGAHQRLGTRELLRERVKELTCVYEISRVAAADSMSAKRFPGSRGARASPSG